MILVYLPDMLLQVEVPAESLPANVAVEGFHRKVRVHVETQVRHLNIDDLFIRCKDINSSYLIQKTS